MNFNSQIDWEEILSVADDNMGDKDDENDGTAVVHWHCSALMLGR